MPKRPHRAGRRRAADASRGALRPLPDSLRTMLETHERDRALAWSRLGSIAPADAAELRRSLVADEDALAASLLGYRRGRITLATVIGCLSASRARFAAVDGHAQERAS